MCLPHSNIARPSQAKRSHSLRNGPLDSCSLTIFLFKFLGLLTLTGLLQRLVKVFGLDIDRSYPPLGSRTLREVGADAAIRPCKLRVDEIIPAPKWLPVVGDLKIQPIKVGFAAYYDSAGRVDLMESHKDEKPVFISGKDVRKALTALAVLPPGSSRTLGDPYAEKKQPWALYFALVLIVVLAGTYYMGKIDHYLPPEVKSQHVLGDWSPLSTATTTTK